MLARTAWVIAPERQQSPRYEQLDCSVLPSTQQFGASSRPCCLKASSIRAPLFPVAEVDRPAIVRIDEAEVPQLAALVDVGDTRRGQLQDRLRQAIQHTRDGDLAMKVAKVGEKGIGPRDVETPATSESSASSYSLLGLIQLECVLPHGPP